MEKIKKDTDILKIVKEDILENLEKNIPNEQGVKLSSIKPEIKVSYFFINKAIKELKKENLIQIKRLKKSDNKNSRKDLVYLTKKGKLKAKNIAKKHLILERYFKKTKSKKQAYELASIFEHYVSMRVINNIKKLTTLKKKGIPLINFKPGGGGLIANILLNNKLFERMISMGIFPGERIKVRNKLSNGIIIETENKKFALADEIAKKIKVVKR